MGSKTASQKSTNCSSSFYDRGTGHISSVMPVSLDILSDIGI